MTSTGTVTTAVAQELFQVAADGAVAVLASSFDGAQAEDAWLTLVRPHLSFTGMAGLLSPAHTLSYLVFPDGFAAVLRRTLDTARPGFVITHALLGSEDTLTSELALSTVDWPGWLTQPPAEHLLPSLAADELHQPNAAGGFHARALSQGDILARSLAWLLQSNGAPIGLVGCPPEDRTAILWALWRIAAPELPERDWTFATHYDGVTTNGPAVTFFEAVPEWAVTPEMIIIDLRQDQGASPQNEYRSNALVYRYEYGIDPPSADFAPPAPVPAIVARDAGSEPLTRSDLSLERWSELARGLASARDVRSVDGALVELEYEVAKVDDRDDTRKALEDVDWATAVIRRHVPGEFQDAVLDRVVNVAFGATGPGRMTRGARADARRLAASSRATDVVRAIARVCAEGELADVLAHRWLLEHDTADSEPQAGRDLLSRFFERFGAPITPKWARRAILLLVLLAGLVLGVLVGGVLW